jgi:hypothetical protein
VSELLNKALDFLRVRRMAYVKTFQGPLADEVLKDLAKFCRAHESTFNPDGRAHALMEGRREVWLRIQNHLQLTDEQLWERYGQKKQ